MARKDKDGFIPKFPELQDLVKRIGDKGTWLHKQTHLTDFYQFQAPSGAVLNFWPATSTISFQGEPAAAAEFRERVIAAAGRDYVRSSRKPTPMATIFRMGERHG